MATANYSGAQTRAPRALVSSDRVEGTSVYAPDGEKLGAVHHLMIDKASGRVDYVVMSFGGLFGLGEDYYPLPWDVLEYDVARGGYVTQIDRAALNTDAPHYSAQDEPDWDSAFPARLDTHYERARL